VSQPTIKDVAERAGVSASAVSMYLNNRPGLSRPTQTRIADAIAELGYVPRTDGRRNASSGFVGLIVEKLPLSLRGDHFYADVTDGIQHEAERLGYTLAISVLNEPPVGLPRMVEEQQIAGILGIGGGDVTDDLLHRIADRNIPLVTVDNQSSTRILNNVVVDNHRGAYLALRHLIELGHERIAIIRGPEKYKSLTERYQGYVQALYDAGLPLDPALIQQPISKGLPRKGYLEAQQILKLDPLPTAIFAVTDRTALGALDALREHGLRVPEDISITGFDDMPPDVYSHRPLTSVTSKRFEMGRVAMQRLHALIADPSLVPIKLVMPTELVVRESTAAPHLKKRNA
jgi:DNA-binding LacI/PurR family transcriptional regulator